MLLCYRLDEVYYWNASALCQRIAQCMPFDVDGNEVLMAAAAGEDLFQNLVDVCMCKCFGDALALQFVCLC